MTRPDALAARGFTLIETIIAIVITGIVAGIVALFIARPIQGYLDAARRAGMTDAADTALRRVAHDIRQAVPNTVRLADGGRYLEFIPTRDGGRYRAQRDGVGCPPAATDPHADPIFNADDCVFPGNPDNDRFDVLGPPVAGGAGDFVVIFNTGQNGLDAYQSGQNRRTVGAITPGKVSFNATAALFPPFESPSQRFQIVPVSGPLSYGCVAVAAPAGFGGFQLWRFTAYRAGVDNWSAQPTAPQGAAALLASDLSECRFAYDALSATNGLVIARLAVQRENETVSLVHEVHVDNTP